MTRYSKLGTPLGGVALLALIVLIFPVFGDSNYLLRVMALVWIMSLGAVGLHILMGQAGQISLGHAGFFGIGAYAIAVLPAHWGCAPLVAALIGAVASGVIAWLVGMPILRLKGHYLAIATLGFSLLVALVITSEVNWTGGPDGIGVPRPTFGGLSVASPLAWYWISGVLLIGGVAVAVLMRDSPTGRALRGILESEVAAASMGVDVARRKRQAFVIAAIYASVAGSLLAMMNGFVTPDVASLMSSVEFVAMAVIGGVSTPLGAVVGAALLTLLPQLLASFHDYEDITVGLVIMVSMIVLRQGIVPAVWRMVDRRAQ